MPSAMTSWQAASSSFFGADAVSVVAPSGACPASAESFGAS